MKGNSFYNRYFEDYVETPVLSDSGTPKVKRVYVGNYYRQKLTKWQIVCLRVLYVLLFAGAAVLFVNAALQDIISNVMFLVVIPTAASSIMLIFLLIALLCYVAAKWEMTVGEYRETSGMVKRYSLIAGLCLLCTALCVFLSAAIRPGKMPSEELYNGLKFLASSFLILIMRFLEEKIPYETRPSGNVRPDGGLKI